MASSERNCPGTDGGDSPGGDFVGIKLKKAQTNIMRASARAPGLGRERFGGFGVWVWVWGLGLDFGRLGLVPMTLGLLVLVLPSYHPSLS